MSDLGQQGDISGTPRDVRFSNRPIGVKRFQTIHHDSVDGACFAAQLRPGWQRKTAPPLGL
jgi:hypothetical protein